MAKDLTIYKYIALGAMGLYAYKKFQSDPISLGRSSQDVSNKANKLIDNITEFKNMPPHYRAYINNIAKNMAKKYIETKMAPLNLSQTGFQNARDVTGSAK